MARWQLLCLGFGIAVGAALAAGADEPGFNVKPGLWETTTSGTATGAPPLPPEVLAKMSPEQRAKVEAAIKDAMARSSKPRTHQSCVTAEQLQRGVPWLNKPSCTHTVLKRTASEIAVRQECSEESERMSGSIHIRAPNPETIVGTTDFAITNASGTMTVQQNFSGRWLGADCGNVKPAPTR